LSDHQKNQLFLTVERIRCPEVLFQPSLIGLNSTGLIETIDIVLNNLNQYKKQLINVLLITNYFKLIECVHFWRKF
jgi:hypothetical protein